MKMWNTLMSIPLNLFYDMNYKIKVDIWQLNWNMTQ